MASPAGQLEKLMLPSVGASMRLDENGKWVSNRDGVDKRIINEYNTNKGIVPDNETEVGGFAVIEGGVPYADSDHDGMPDKWEIMYCLNPKDPGDGNKDADNDGYTNIEEFLNGTNPNPECNPDISSKNTKIKK